MSTKSLLCIWAAAFLRQWTQKVGEPVVRRFQRLQPRIEILENRTLLSTCTVDRLTDTGDGSGLIGDLRYCIATSISGEDTITFRVQGVIHLTSALPTLNVSVRIEGPGVARLEVRRSSTTSFRIFTVVGAADVWITGLTIANGLAAQGGGIYVVDSNLTLSDSVLTDNEASDGVGYGGGIYVASGAVSINGSTLSGNHVLGRDGSPGDFGGDGSPASGGGIYVADGTLLVSNTTIAANRAIGGNGGNAFLNGGGEGGTGGAAAGGGVYVASGRVEIRESVLSANEATGGTGGRGGNLACGDGGPGGPGGAGKGGGLHIADGTNFLYRSTLSSNRTTGGRGGPAGFGGGFRCERWDPAEGGDGGGAAAGGLHAADGTVEMHQSTVSNNEALGGNGGAGAGYSGGQATGGGLCFADGSVVLEQNTIAANRALGGNGSWTPANGNGGGLANSATLQTRNTIVAGNSASSNAPDLRGDLGSLGHNLIADDNGGSGFTVTDVRNTDPLLGPLQNNGGPTFTHALLPGSPALDAGDNAHAPDVDQRGLPRVVADAIDIGALEVQPGPATWFWLDVPASVASGGPFDVTLYALDDYGHLATGYTGTVSFSTSDKNLGVMLPADYLFTAADQGIHTFTSETVLLTSGEQSLWAQDTDSDITAEAVVTVVPGGSPAPGDGRRTHAMDWLRATDVVLGLPPRRKRSGW